MRIVYLHGFASSPQSSKAQFFLERFTRCGVTVEIPQLDGGDFEHLTITGQLAVVHQAVGTTPSVLMGSSLGGYLAALYAARHPETVEKVILMAPAFQFPKRWRDRYSQQDLEDWRHQGSVRVYHYGYKAEKDLSYGLIDDAQQYENEPDFSQPVLLFHGTGDQVVPVSLSEEFAARHPNATLYTFDSGHELTDVLEPMWQAVESFLFEPRPSGSELPD
jgi:pimeloyl-ACP methyl ester carboxylesterase